MSIVKELVERMKGTIQAESMKKGVELPSPHGDDSIRLQPKLPEQQRDCSGHFQEESSGSRG